LESHTVTAWWSRLTLLCLRFNRPLHTRQSLLINLVLRLNLETLLIRIQRCNQVTNTVQRSTLASPTLCPVRFDLRYLLSILESVLVVALGSICGGAVGVEDVVFWLEGDGLREFVATASSLA
jgi:hypothetical protein